MLETINSSKVDVIDNRPGHHVESSDRKLARGTTSRLEKGGDMYRERFYQRCKWISVMVKTVGRFWNVLQFNGNRQQQQSSGKTRPRTSCACLVKRSCPFRRSSQRPPVLKPPLSGFGNMASCWVRLPNEELGNPFISLNSQAKASIASIRKRAIVCAQPSNQP